MYTYEETEACALLDSQQSLKVDIVHCLVLL